MLDLLRDFARQGQITKTVLNTVSSSEIGCTFCNKNLRCETSEQSTDMETEQSVQTENDDYDSNDGEKITQRRLGDTSRGEVSPSDARSLGEDEQEEAEMSNFKELDDNSKNEFVNDSKVVDFGSLDSDSKVDLESDSSTDNPENVPTTSESTFFTTGRLIKLLSVKKWCFMSNSFELVMTFFLS